MEYINKTGASFPQTEVNLRKVNSTVNNLVDAVNYLLSGICNINAEIGNYTKTFTLLEAIQSVSNIRRAKGMKIRFLDTNNKYVEYSYIGSDLDDVNWKNVNNWVSSISYVDGGTF